MAIVTQFAVCAHLYELSERLGTALWNCMVPEARGIARHPLSKLALSW